MFLKHLSAEAQIAVLRPTAGIGIYRNLHQWLVGCAIALAVLSVIVWNPLPLMFAALLGIVGFMERRALPNRQNALLAYDTLAPSSGWVSIAIAHGDGSAHFHAMVKENGKPDWSYEFVPQGWLPVAGVYPARIWRMDPAGAPALAIVDEGILVPRRDPVLAAT